jgi:acyl transferase domain-containing protein/NAD(P)-dependent dehydrogenase (short-subunit alcohol dehydrogenase family)/acyl carrier protein
LRARLKASGVNLYLRTDLSNLELVSEALSVVEQRFSKIDGIFHLAGITDDRLIVNSKPAKIAEVFAGKVGGALNLLRLVPAYRPHFICNFSSLSSLLGNIGQADYAGANAFLDSIAGYAEDTGIDSTYWCSINWGLWASDGMQVPDGSKDRLPLEPKEACQAMAHVLNKRVALGVIFAGTRDELRGFASAAVSEGETVQPAIMVKAAHAEALRAFVRSLVYKFSRLEDVPGTQSLVELGLDSVAIINMVASIEHRLAKNKKDLSLNKALIFSYPTIDAIVDYLVGKYPELISSAFGDSEPAAGVSAQAEVQSAAVIPGHLARTETGKAPASVVIDESEQPGARWNSTHYRPNDVAIVGMAGEFPGADNISELWELLELGESAISVVPASRWDWQRDYSPDPTRKNRSYGRHGGFIRRGKEFDPSFFGILPVHAPNLDPQERRLLEMTYHALEDSGYFAAPMENTGVFTAAMYSHYQTMDGESSTISSSFASIANRISYTFNFQGPSICSDTMCSGSLTALHLAVNSVRAGECRQAVVGAVNLMPHPGKYRLLSDGKFLSPTGRCHSFGIEADGYVPGEGAIAIVIKPLQDALAAHDRIHGIIRATAINSGGRSSSFTVPSQRAQEKVIKTALQAADVPPKNITYIEAHGTGTSLGDPIEIQALSAAYGPHASGLCFVGSIKSNIGHLEPAAGLAGLTKVLLQFQNRKVVPTINCTIENPYLNLHSTRFRLPRTAAEWPGKQGTRFASLSSFGAGGSNAHVVLQEYVAQRQSEALKFQQFLIPVSAKTERALTCRVTELANWIEKNPEAPIYAVAYTLSICREHFSYRTCFVVHDLHDLLEQLRVFCKSGSSRLSGDMEEQVSTKRNAYLTQGVVQFLDIYSVREVISLPNYPFEQQEYWNSEIIEKWAGNTVHPQIDQDSHAQSPVQFIVFEPGWGPAPHTTGAPRQLPAPTVLAICDPEQAAMLETHANIMTLTTGESFRLHEKGAIVRPGSLEDCVAALQNLSAAPGFTGSSVLVLLRGEWVRHIGCSAMLRFHFNIAKAILGLGREFKGICVHLAGDGGSDSAMAGSIAGLFKVAAMEEDRLQFRFLELEDASLGEVGPILQRGTELDSVSEVRGCRQAHGTYLMRELREIEIPEPAVGRFKQRGVYLITGGAGMIGYAIAQKLLAKFGANVVLLGRTEYNDSLATRLGALQMLGGSVQYVSTDVTDADAVRRVVESIRADHGGLNGVVHCAGTLSDTLLRNKNWTEFEKVVGVKLQGAQNLDTATADCELDFFVLFSSMSSIFGNVGQTDYVVGNSFLDLFARVRARNVTRGTRSGLSLSINWPLWIGDSGGGHDPMSEYRSLDKYLFEAYGLRSLTMENGADIFIRVVNGLPISVSQITPLTGDFEKIRRSVVTGVLGTPGRQQLSTPEQPAGGGANPQALMAPLCSIVAELTGLISNDIPVRDGFGDLGFSSVMLQDMATRIEKEFGISMPPSAFFSHPTIEKLAAYLAGRGAHATDRPARKEIQTTVASATEPESISPANFPTIGRLPAVHPPMDDFRVAIVGMDGRMPGGRNLQEFWDGLVSNASAIHEVKRWSRKKYHAGVIADIEQFDARFFDISAREATLMDPQHRLFIQASYNAILDAGYAPGELSRVGVFAGVQFGDYLSLLQMAKRESHPYAATGNAHAMLANRVSYVFDFHGPSETIDTACSSALVAVHRAVAALARNECDHAIVGAVSLLLDSAVTDAAETMGILSPNHRCATFDADADGYVRAEGVGCVVLKRYTDAVAAGDSICAVIESVKENHGGRTTSLTAPNPEAQKSLLVAAYTPELASRVTYIETHGTGTKLGDPVEIDALKAAWSTLLGGRRQQPIYLGAVKTNVGHLEPAAGIAGLLKVILCLKHKSLPANINFSRINPYIDFNGSPFSIIRRNMAWQSEGLRVAGISSFGFGGTNAHLVLSEAPPRALVDNSDFPCLVVLSAKSAASLIKMKDALLKHLLSPEARDLALTDLALTLAKGRNHFEYRLAWVVSSLGELADAVRRTDPATIQRITKGGAEANGFGHSGNGFSGGRDLSAVRDSYLRGAESDWNSFFRQAQGCRVHVPGYVFDTKAFWFEGIRDAEESTEPSKNGSKSRWA